MKESSNGSGESEPAALTVMSYNVRYDTPTHPEHPWRSRRDHVASVIRFHRPAVVGLQEASPGHIEDLRERLPRYEWLVAGRAEAKNAGEYAAIGFVDERFELETDSSFWLSETPDEVGSVGWDAQLPRLVRYVRLREYATDAEFYLFNTHFDHAGDRARELSAKFLRRRIDDVASPLPVIVTGDLNSRPTETPYRILTNGDDPGPVCPLRDTFREAGNPHGPNTTMTDFETLVPEKRIDHVLVSDDVDVLHHTVPADTTGDGTFPSDHLPVLTELSVQPTRSGIPERSSPSLAESRE